MQIEPLGLGMACTTLPSLTFCLIHIFPHIAVDEIEHVPLHCLIPPDLEPLMCIKTPISAPAAELQTGAIGVRHSGRSLILSVGAELSHSRAIGK